MLQKSTLKKSDNGYAQVSYLYFYIVKPFRSGRMSESGKLSLVTCTAPVNIAVIKGPVIFYKSYKLLLIKNVISSTKIR